MLLPADDYGRLAERLSALDHDLEPLLWRRDGVSLPDGSHIADANGVPTGDAAYAPEAAWASIGLLFGGNLAPFVEAALAPGTLRWAQACLAGTDAPPFQQLINAGVQLSRSDAPNDATAEHTMSLVLSTFHDWAGRIDRRREGTWLQAPWREVRGSRWLIVGFGSIGHKVAALARPFGATVVGARRSAASTADLDAADAMVTMTAIAKELPLADVVVLTCPLTDATRGLVDAEFLAAMRDDAVLVNVARGAVIDTDALLRWLDGDREATAVLDVFDIEPLPDGDPLWQHPKVVMTTHIGGAGSGMTARNDDLFIAQLDSFLAGRTPRLLVEG